MDDLNLTPYPYWEEGTNSQQEFANKLVEEFCERFSKKINNAVNNNVISEIEAVAVANAIFMAIDSINDARWWCDKKSANDFNIASKLLENDEFCLEIIKKMKK